MANKQDAIRKINAMRKMTEENGASENEALAALSKMGKLLEEFNLSLDELDLDESKCFWGYFYTDQRKSHPILHTAGAVTAWTGCKGVIQTVHKTQKMHIGVFGLESDVTVSLYIFEIIFRAMEDEYKKFFKDYKKTDEYKYRKHFHIKAVKDSFQTGLALRICQRISEMYNEKQKQEAALAITGTSLIVSKNQLIEDEFNEVMGDIKKFKQKPKFEKGSTALRAGFIAGDKVPLNPGVTNS